MNNKEFIDNVNIIKLENKATEAQSIFHYIIHYYDNLTNYNIFIQDDSHHHIPDFNHFITYCNNCIDINIGFKDYPASFRADKGQGRTLRRIKNGNMTRYKVLVSIECHFCEKIM